MSTIHKSKTYPNPNIPVGTIVRSRYAAPWTGVVIEDLSRPRYDGKGIHHVVACSITHDRNGNPMRKPMRSMSLDTSWLEILELPEPKKP